MNNSNSFNVCSRCGSANSLSAKYCYQCGSQLKVPEEPVVCHKCHSVNSNMANFCRTCGTMLKTGAKTKTCPCCKRQIPIEQTQCSCGYSFPAVGEQGDGVQKQKGGRLVALLSLFFTALFALAVALPFQFMQSYAVQSNLHVIGFLGENGVLALGIVDIVYTIIEIVESVLQSGVLTFDSLFVLMCLVSVFVLTVAVQVICALIRLIHGKRGKKANVFYLIMTLLTGAVAALFVVGNLQLYSAEFFKFFILPAGYSLGWGIFVIPAFYLFFFIFSFFAKCKKVKKSV